MNIAPLVVIALDPAVPRSDRLNVLIDRLVAEEELARLFERDGLLVLGKPDASHLLMPGGSGLIWGTLFDRTTSWRVAAPAELREGNAPAEQFIERYWGGYLAVRERGDAVEILRDPSGAIPCYQCQFDGASIFTTRVTLLTDAGAVRPEVDWTIVTQSLVFQDLRPARTALRGVAELMPGTCVTLQRGSAQVRTVWTPWQFAAADLQVTSLEEAVEQVARVTTNCITAWARCFNRPLLELSGGLDSSIVAAVLAKANPNTHCVTFGAIEGDPDETPYAAAAAERLGLTLEVMRPDISLVDVTQSAARGLPRPSARAFSQAHDLGLRAIAEREDADAFFSGGGGDNVFAYLRSVLPVIDRWKQGGGGVLKTVGEIAALSDVSFWRVFAASLRRGLRRRAAHPWLAQTSFMSQRALRDLPFPHGHPWIDVPAAIPPGKRVHGLGIIVIQNHLEGFGRLHDAPIVSPLISQPLVETCMAIPTWLWCSGGENRAVARRAFANRLPRAVVHRRSKGAFDTYSSRVFDANRGGVREMLLNGKLQAQGLIDTGLIAKALDQASISKVEIVRLLELVDVEAWLDAWAMRATVTSAP